MNTLLKPIVWIMAGILMLTACATPVPPTAEQQAQKLTPTQAVTATPSPVVAPTVDPEFVAEIEAIRQKCSGTQAGQVCYGQGPIAAQAQPERLVYPFWGPGSITNLADLHRLKVGSAGSKEGLALLLIQTENPGQAFTAVAFGDVDLVNEVPYGVQEFGGMQSMRLTTGPNAKGKAPTSGLLVQAPGDGQLSTLVVNGVELIFGSTALLTSSGQSLTVRTLAGTVLASTPIQKTAIGQGAEAEVPLEPLVQPEGAELLEPLVQPEVPLEWLVQPEGYDLIEPLIPLEGSDLVVPLVRLLPENPDAYAESSLQEIADMIKKRLEERKKQKNWKGGWWRETYGPSVTSGDCREEMEAAGDGGGGGSVTVEPYSREIPICRGNNGNTILIYDTGTSYERVGPNTYVQASVSEYDLYGKGNFEFNSDTQTLRILSPTRMTFTYTRSSGKGCTSTQVTYLDFVRDDPNVRCGRIIDLFPEPPRLTPEPEEVVPTQVPTPAPTQEPPVEGKYTAQIGLLAEGCDAQATAFAPNFQTAAVSFSAEKNLILEAPSARYELGLTNKRIGYYSERTEDYTDKYGLFALEQPLTDSFQMMMSMMAVPGHGFLGDWLVTNPDGSQWCEGSILLTAAEEPENAP